MRENESLSMAQEMVKTGDYLTKRVYFHNAFEDIPGVKKDVGIPLVSYQIVLSWRLFGQNLWAPRLFNVIFGVLSIIIIYFISRALFQDINVSLWCASLLAVMPLGVFFSRNLQAESPGFFFMLLGNLFYLRAFSIYKRYKLILGGLAFCVAFLYELRFAIGVFPLLFCALPVIMRDKKNISLKSIMAFFLPYAALFICIGWLMLLGQWGIDYRIKPFDIFSLSYWKSYGGTIIWYIKDENFTSIYSFLAVCGMALAYVKRRGLIDRYILGWIFSIIVYGIFFSETINQNSFGYMPFLAVVCIASAYAVLYISEEIKSKIRVDVFAYCAFFVLLVSMWPVYQSLLRIQSTAFWGGDVAGETLREFTSQDERIFLFAHPQGHGIARYAQRYMGTPVSEEDFKEKEQRHNIRFICFYPREYVEALKKNMPFLFNYIRDNYSVKEVGLMENPNRIVYLILEKGFQKGKSLDDFKETVSGNLSTRAIYKVWGKYVFFYTIRP